MSTNRRTSRLAVVIVAVVAVCMIAVAAKSVIHRLRAPARMAATKADLKRIMAAMHQYHDEYNSFPPAFVVGPDGKRWHSWRALILPYLEPELAKTYHLDEPWNGPRNATLLVSAPAVFQSDRFDSPGNATSYFAVVGKRTLWPAHQSVQIPQITDGVSNTIALVEDARTDVQWLEPTDLMPGEFFKSFYDGQHLSAGGARLIAVADGTVRFVSDQVDRTILAGLLTPSYMTDTFRGNDWPSDLVDTPAKQTLRPPVDAATLKQTRIVATPTCDLDASHNQLWAAAFQIAWDDLKKTAGGPIHLDGEPPLAALLNDECFDLASLSPESYLTGKSNAETEQDNLLAEAIRNKFPDVNYSLQPLEKQSHQWGLRLFAMIRKRMPFETLFSRFSRPLKMQGHEANGVNSFGQDPGDEGLQNAHLANHDAVFRNQLEILDDLGDDSFVIRLKTTGGQQDEVVLAMTPPLATLADTWESVKERIRRPNPQHSRRQLEACETLQIPITDFSLSHHFHELEGHGIAGFGDPASLAIAFIDIRLRLDETGADFMSAGEAGVIGEFGEESYDPQRIRRLVFDKPFFIAMKEPGDKHPWFIGWIANTELMEPFKLKRSGE